jgi:putative ABC transport system permease protein
MAMLGRKLVRDLLHIRGQAIAIILVIACGVAAFVTMRSMYRSLLRSQADYYARYRFADVFAELKRAPDWVANRIREIPGVAQVQPRVVMDVTLNVPGLKEPAVGRLISMPAGDSGALNELFLRSGRFIDSHAANEVIASEAFASANHLHLGSTLQAIIHGRWQQLTVVGIALSPEYIYEIRGGASLFPDNRRFGVLWMSPEALQAALDMQGAFNSIAVSLRPHASEPEVIASMDRILDRYGCLGAYGREDQISHRFISDEISQNRISAMIIPAIFLVVAGMLVHLSFSRLVNMQRSEIAVIKAFGFTSRQIATHYVQFSLLIASVGYMLGCIVGWAFGIRLAKLYAEFYRFPILIYRPELSIFLWAGFICAVTAVAGALAPVLRAAALPPAEAMRPESPQQFSPTLMDRLNVRVRSAALRMIVRNLERRPWRALASAFAICTAIMIVVVEFGMFDSLDRIMELQFRDTQREDITVTFNEARSGSVRQELAHLPGVIASEPFRAVPVRLRFQHRSRKTSLLGLASGSRMRLMIDQQGRQALMPPDGLILSTTLAELLHVAPGESVQVEVLEGHRLVRSLPVAALVDEPLGTSAYMELNALNRILLEGNSISGAYLQVDAARQQVLYQRLKTLPAVAAVAVKKTTVDSFRDTINRSMALSLGTLILFAAIIAAGMIYNGARIALSERARELATLRILGFTRQEITSILLGEQALITLFALPFGFLAGYGLCALMAARLQTELYRMPLVVRPTSYAWAFLMVLFSAILSGVLVGRRIAHLDMISVLKSRE